MTTGGGVTVTRTVQPFDPAELARIAQAVDRRRGGVLSSGMEYPGRYSRWHMAYVNPPVEITTHGRYVTARALNERGEVILPVIADAMRRVGHEQPGDPDNSKRRDAGGRDARVTVVIPEGGGDFTEEERSRRPTVFTALREIAAAFGCADPHLGLYGAFGYDLAFQFEPVRLRMDRPPAQRDLVLHLPDEIWVLDRRREEALQYAYEFTVAGINTPPVTTLVGINTLLLLASPTPTPDMVALAATSPNNGIAQIPGVTGTGVFARLSRKLLHLPKDNYFA